VDITTVDLDTFHDELDRAMGHYAAGRTADAVQLMSAYIAKL
jgi:hypothetical protein